jgi:hypothetical protein
MQVPSRGHPFGNDEDNGKDMTCDAQVVGVAGYTPPARSEQLGSLLSCEILEAYSR